MIIKTHYIFKWITITQKSVITHYNKSTSIIIQMHNKYQKFKYNYKRVKKYSHKSVIKFAHNPKQKHHKHNYASPSCLYRVPTKRLLQYLIVPLIVGTCVCSWFEITSVRLFHLCFSFPIRAVLIHSSVSHS